MSQNVLKVDGFCKTYTNGNKQTNAIDCISFEVAEGELLAIMGPSGSGKSTILNLIGALDFPDAGNLYIYDKNIKDFFVEPHATKYRQEKIGFVFQNYNLLKELTAEENIYLPLLLRGKKYLEVKMILDVLISKLNLDSIRDQKPRDMSGGQQQRVAIARALVTNPPILLADEPTGNLDYNSTTSIMKLLMNIKRDMKQSIIIVTHDPYVASCADRTLFFKDGKIYKEYQKKNNNDCIKDILDIFGNLLEEKAC